MAIPDIVARVRSYDCRLIEVTGGEPLVQEDTPQLIDLLAYLGKEHDSLRVKNKDSNTSRWPLHPLWQDLLSQISRFDCFGIDRVDGRAAVLEERLTRMAISLYGYMKRVAAIKCVQERKDKMLLGDTFESIRRRILNIHEPFSWELDVKRRTKEIQLGKW